MLDTVKKNDKDRQNIQNAEVGFFSKEGLSKGQQGASETTVVSLRILPSHPRPVGTCRTPRSMKKHFGNFNRFVVCRVCLGKSTNQTKHVGSQVSLLSYFLLYLDTPTHRGSVWSHTPYYQLAPGISAAWKVCLGGPDSLRASGDGESSNLLGWAVLEGWAAA